MAGRPLRILAAVFLLGGCSTAAEVTGTATQHDLVQIRADVASLQASARQLKAQAEGLGPQVDGRLRDQAADLERQANALGSRLDGLATSVTGLSSRVDELSTRMEALSRQLGVAPRPPSSSIAPAPGATPSPGAVVPAPSGTPPQTATPGSPMPPPPPRPTTGTLQPEDIYQAAYIDFSKGAYQLAITNFREFIRRFPDHKLAGNAQYWVGEAYFSLARGFTDGAQSERAHEELGKAIQEFRKVVANYPRGEKTPAALYKEALALIELKQPQVAQARLQYLVDNFPQAEETPMARERLTALKDR
jgi:tol-pal system protein YbgF